MRRPSKKGTHVHDRKTSTLLLAALLALALNAAPTRAEAQVGGGAYDGLFYTSVALVTAPIGLLGATDIIYGAQERLLPAGWAVPQLIMGAMLAGFGTFMADTLGGSTNGEVPALIYGGIPILTGTWFMAHAIWSLAVGDAPPDTVESSDVSLVPLIQPQRGGAFFGVAGTM